MWELNSALCVVGGVVYPGPGRLGRPGVRHVQVPADGREHGRG